jgi:hypothetical protein
VNHLDDVLEEAGVVAALSSWLIFSFLKGVLCRGYRLEVV